MSINVPGIGLVPVVWHPASDEDFKDKSEGARSGYQPIAIVHHRIVGSTEGADGTFAAHDADPLTVGSPGRAVSAHFNVGYYGTQLRATQHVDLSDTAYCNGIDETLVPTNNWTTWGYGNHHHNERTISIEHEDNAGLPVGDPRRGVVVEAVIQLSMALDKLMLSGDINAIRAAGIRIRDQATADALKKIVPGPRTLIDHRDIANQQKPYCWRPWAGDKTGFPRTRYVEYMKAGTPAQEGDMPPLTTPDVTGFAATVKAGVNVRTAPKMTAPARVTAATEAWKAIGWVVGDVDPQGGSNLWLMRSVAGGYEFTAQVNLSAGPTDPTPYSKSQYDAAALAAKQAGYDLAKGGVVIAPGTPTATWPPRP